MVNLNTQFYIKTFIILFSNNCSTKKMSKQFFLLRYLGKKYFLRRLTNRISFHKPTHIKEKQSLKRLQAKIKLTLFWTQKLK